MSLVSWLLSAQTVSGVLLAIALWLAGKLVDKTMEVLFGRKIINPIITGLRWRFQSFWTRVKPITGTFQITYGIRSSLKQSEVKSQIEESLKRVEELTGKRIRCSDPTWRNGEGEFEATHVEAAHDFKVAVTLNRDPEDRVQSPDASPDDYLIQEMNIQIRFEFSFPKIDSELPNVGVFMNKLEDALDENFGGNGGPAKIILHPLESDLSLDDWIEKENLEPTLRLTGRKSPTSRTEVEFFSDHVELYPPYYEIDGEIIRYVQLLVKNYYLANSNSDNILLPSGSTKT